MFKRFLYLSFIIVALFGCAKKFENKKQLLAFIADESNGLTSKKVLDHVDVAVSFLPWQTQAFDDSFSKTKLNKAQLKQLAQKYYFLVSLSKDHKEVLKQLPFNEYSEMVQVLSFRMQNYIGITLDDEEKVAPLTCLFQPTYGYANANTILVVFEKSKLEKAKQIQFFMIEFGFKTGNITFDFNSKTIEKISKNSSLPTE
ncbi:hypothetical protein [Pedobacter chitinilyticus]|uniref:Lipoprotein n=1 Tax=Pedobacter chitinilyticus TaxID=2233776 RepID=A0A3S4RSD0_9SPHI|nr:hypothetical protein [Pedobacter chitinilyticus]RWU09943.1 hypothetical protein DPV69_00935 [Pedobacter chitinilyticus]